MRYLAWTKPRSSLGEGRVITTRPPPFGAMRTATEVADLEDDLCLGRDPGGAALATAVHGAAGAVIRETAGLAHALDHAVTGPGPEAPRGLLRGL